jgi:hypothetical protein
MASFSAVSKHSKQTRFGSRGNKGNSSHGAASHNTSGRGRGAKSRFGNTLGADRFARNQWNTGNLRLQKLIAVLANEADEEENLCDDEERFSNTFTKELRAILELFRSIEYPSKAVPKSDCSKTARSLCAVFPSTLEDGEGKRRGLKVFKELSGNTPGFKDSIATLKNEVCAFIEVLTLQQEVEYAAKDIGVILEFFIGHMESSNSIPAVKALTAILKDHNARSTVYFPKIVETLIGIGEQSTVAANADTVRSVLFCMGNICGGSSSNNGATTNQVGAGRGGANEGSASTTLREGLKASRADRMFKYTFRIVQEQFAASNGVAGNSIPLKPDILSASIRTLASMIFCLPHMLESFHATKELAVMLHELLRFEGKKRPTSASVQSVASKLSNVALESKDSLSWRSPRKGGPPPGFAATSDSDTCASDNDTDGNNMYSSSRSHRVSIRLHALSALLAICRAEPKVLLGRWVFFIPESSRAWADRNGEEVGKKSRRKGRYRSLVEVMLHERSWRLRSAAACLIVCLLESAPLSQWLPKVSAVTAKSSRNAEEEGGHKPSSPSRLQVGRSRAFTPMSSRIAMSLETLHIALYTALKKEAHSAVVPQILRCITSVFHRVPYNQVDSHVQQTVHLLMLYIVQLISSSGDQATRSVAFNAIGAAVSTKNPLGEIDTLLRKPSLVAPKGRPKKEGSAGRSDPSEGGVPASTNAPASQPVSKRAWVPPHRRASAKFQGENENQNVVASLLKIPHADQNILFVIGKMAKTYPVAVGGWWEGGVRQKTIGAFKSREHRVREYAIKIVDALMKGGVRLDGLEAIIIEQVTRAMADTNNSVRTSALQLIQGLGPLEWKSLPENVKNNIIQLVCVGFKDSAPKVRTASSYVAGTFVMHECFQTEKLLTIFARSMLSLVKEEDTLVVVSRCAWAMANLCLCIRTLVKTDCSDPYALPKQISDAVIYLAQNYEDQSQTQDKIRTSSIRALGALGQFWASVALSTTDEANEFQTAVNRRRRKDQNAEGMVTQHERVMLEAIARTLMKHLEKGSSKTIWNACHAMGGIFETACAICEPGFLIKQDWHDDALTLLITCLNSSNFKVRINAVVALRALKTRDDFVTEGQRGKTRNAVAGCLAAIDDDTNFSQYQYKETLTEECQTTLDHLDGMCGGQ